MSSVTTAAGITLEYDTFGRREDPALLLVMGFTAQMIAWHEGFCQRLADGGHYVIRFDNRDCGLSTKIDGAIDMGELVTAMATGGVEAVRNIAKYTLTEFADDAFGLLTALGIERAHIAGASMGGMIVQTMAIMHPERVLSMTSVMSTTGEPEYGQSTDEARAALLAPRPTNRAEYIDAAPRSLVFQSKKYGSADLAKQNAAASFDRSFCPDGVARQFAAIVASGPRADALRQLTVPTLVIHGNDDTLIQPNGGARTAELIPGARLVMVDDMGHDLPEPLWPQICGAILEHTATSAG